MFLENHQLISSTASPSSLKLAWFIMSLHSAFLSLGSNIEPETNLVQAVRELNQLGNITAVAQVWETLPVGMVDQPNFLNSAVLLETKISAVELREKWLPAIEVKLNRQRDPHNKNAPRTIDIDLSLYDDEVLTIGTREIPDPDILTRAFVAIPLAELQPKYQHPIDGRTLTEIAAAFESEKYEMQLREDVRLEIT